MGVDLAREAHEAAARGTGGCQCQREGPDAQPATAQEVFAQEIAVLQQAVGVGMIPVEMCSPI